MSIRSKFVGVALGLMVVSTLACDKMPWADKDEKSKKSGDDDDDKGKKKNKSKDDDEDEVDLEKLCKHVVVLFAAEKKKKLDGDEKKEETEKCVKDAGRDQKKSPKEFKKCATCLMKAESPEDVSGCKACAKIDKKKTGDD